MEKTENSYNIKDSHDNPLAGANQNECHYSRSQAEGVKRTQLPHVGEETADFFTKYGFKTCDLPVFPNSLQPTA